MAAVCSKCQNSFTPQVKYNKTIPYYRMCDICRSKKTNVHVDCVNNDKFNILITDLHESI